MRTFLGVCELCGDEVYDDGPLRAINAYRCGRCGRWVCSGCGGYNPGDGYGIEDEAEYGQICKECYYELQAEYAAKWKAEFGAEEGARMENPYDCSEEAREWKEHLRSYQRWRDNRER